MARTGLGFDTGGTYTDAVVMDMDSGGILARSKSLTTRRDLSIGIRGAVSGFDEGLLGSVDVVFLSSTLATNSVVEGKGCRVGLVVMGYDLDVDAPAAHILRTSGRHTASGREEEPMDEGEVRAFLESLRGRVDCIAATGFMSVRNPEHEARVKRMAEEVLGIPTVCGYELSSALGFNERTVTCVMNARLIPVIGELLRSVNSVLAERGISAPLMVVKGDGSVMGEDMARERPVETILSGPASSLNGAIRLAGISDAIVVDIGGTTTDIGILRGGRPNLSPDGAVIGGFRTRVSAAEITTAGIGGDSRIVVNGSEVSLSPLRIVPLCMASSEHPGLRGPLEALLSGCPRAIRRTSYPRNIEMDTEFFLKLKDPAGTDLTENDLRLLDFIDGIPRSMAEVRRALGEPPISFSIPLMEERGIIQRIGLTPTDIMHIRGTFDAFDAAASLAGARYHASNL
ncbi:MAG: hydantoinase/oxoprolinase family protein, partial [Thermoplasmata archaeon]|nr:hydantoinase/oxoprolinase family protein [Thermoplasmata archaeon]